MWKRMTAVGLAGTGWAITTADALSLLPPGDHDSLARLAVGVAICASAQLMLWCHERPIAQAFDLGYYRGRRDQMREVNARPLSPIRRTPKGLGEFDRSHARAADRQETLADFQRVR